MIDFAYQIYLLDNLSVNEMVTENEDGSYTIFINADLSEDKQRQAVYHAFHHIQCDDFGKDDVQMIEVDAHKGKGRPVR